MYTGQSLTQKVVDIYGTYIHTHIHALMRARTHTYIWYLWYVWLFDTILILFDSISEDKRVVSKPSTSWLPSPRFAPSRCCRPASTARSWTSTRAVTRPWTACTPPTTCRTSASVRSAPTVTCTCSCQARSQAKGRLHRGNKIKLHRASFGWSDVSTPRK